MFKFVVLVSFVACAYGAAIPDGMLPQLDGRIVGGADASISNFPYIVSLQASGSHRCGGSIYSTTVIITAAHCMQNVVTRYLKIRAGSTYRSRGGTLVAISSFTNHPNYNKRTMVNDISVIRLSAALSLSSNVNTIALVSSAPATGTAATVAGWGTKTSGTAIIPDHLQCVDVKIISLSKCSSGEYSYGRQIKPSMICAAATGKDSCQGDSGGPLVVNGYLAGIVSWGNGCAAAKYPGVYSNVAALKDWVINNA